MSNERAFLEVEILRTLNDQTLCRVLHADNAHFAVWVKTVALRQITLENLSDKLHQASEYGGFAFCHHQHIDDDGNETDRTVVMIDGTFYLDKLAEVLP